ncbi:MAG: HNH endonuclease signature motif containing protein [Acidimicrobiales bacterium]
MSSTIDQIISLGRELNAHHHRIVCLAAAYDTGLEWFHRGFPSPAAAIARALDIHTATAREWIRVGHALDDLPAIADNELSYAKVRILTRWATPDNEHELLMLAHDRTAGRLTTAIANHLAGEETPDERDRRHHDGRSVTVHTDGDGMIVIRAVLPPNIGKAVAETLNTIIQQVAATPMDASAEALPSPPVSVATSGGQDASADASPLLPVSVATSGGQDASEDVSGTVAVADGRSMVEQLRALKAQWQPADADDFFVPTLAQQRADAFVLLFLGRDVRLVTEVIIHVRGDGTTFDDGTPITDNAVCQRLDQSFIRVMVHDSQRRPINASNRRRHPTIRQRRVVLEAHRHECVDCQSTELLELDHQPPYQQTGRTVTTELEPRCAPCHRARHRT